MKRKGFTLIELMIVVAIIGILMAIAIPQFAQLIQNADRKKRGLPPLAEYPKATCFGSVVSAFPENGKIVKVYSSGCVVRE